MNVTVYRCITKGSEKKDVMTTERSTVSAVIVKIRGIAELFT